LASPIHDREPAQSFIFFKGREKVMKGKGMKKS
jgi:hypothetical protein